MKNDGYEPRAKLRLERRKKGGRPRVDQTRLNQSIYNYNLPDQEDRRIIYAGREGG
jgi:hypothetical protein